MEGHATIEFRCQCGKTLRIGAKHAGARAKCPACGAAVVVPQPVHVAAGGGDGLGSLGSERGAASAGPHRATAGALCAICQSPLHADEPATSCPSCHAHYHADCWQENHGCAVYGCVEVAATEKREALEIPVSFWGQEEKPCPACGQTILAAALRCRHCGATFDTARPEAQHDFQARTAQKQRLPALKQAVVWIFILSILPCTAPFAAMGGAIWYLSHKSEVMAMPTFYSGMCRLGLVVSIGQTMLTVLMAMLYITFRT